jgi:dUTP pyrophosphatase
MTHMPVTVQIRRLPHGRGIDLPGYQSAHAAGMDLHAAVEADLTIEPGATELVPCGFCLAIPEGYEAQVRPRSGLAAGHSITLPNAPGTIDSDYRGEVKVIMMNLGPRPFVVTRNMRIAQMIIAPVSRARWQEVDQLPDTPRGEGGFGHTGH